VVFALAERAPIAGRDLLAAFVVGVEIECRLGNALSPGHYRKGWHITSTCGVFGAALAAGRLLGLDGAQMHAALGIASSQSSGLVETLGSMAKSVGVGASARGGLLAALLARNGLEGPRRPLEGPRGFLAVMSDGLDAAAATQGLGSQWEMLRNMYKPYPCGVVLNPVIDACLDLRQEPFFDVSRIARIEVRGNPLLKERTDRPEAGNGRESQVSAQHAIAVALARGSCGVRDFSDEAVADPSVRAVRRRVAAVVADAGLSVDSIVLSVALQDGAVVEKRVDVPRGSLGRPLADAEIETKFRALAAFGSPSVDVERLLPALWSIGDSKTAAATIALAQ
jgi:2-methylcitrate dehydratase PrpD